MNKNFKNEIMSISGKSSHDIFEEGDNVHLIRNLIQDRGGEFLIIFKINECLEETSMLVDFNKNNEERCISILMFSKEKEQITTPLLKIVKIEELFDDFIKFCHAQYNFYVAYTHVFGSSKETEVKLSIYSFA